MKRLSCGYAGGVACQDKYIYNMILISAVKIYNQDDLSDITKADRRGRISADREV
jgi:hypothetical protein